MTPSETHFCAEVNPKNLAPRGGRDFRGWPFALVIALAGIAAYSNSFSVPFVLDDRGAIVDNPSIRHLARAFAPPPGLTVSGRPLLNLSFALNYAISGIRPWSYHALNLLVHLAAGLALFGLTRRTLARGRHDYPQATWVAFSAALLWTLHPLQTESVTYVAQRAESLAGVFYFLTLYCFVRHAERAGRREMLWATLSALCCALGMATKETMVTAPLVVLLYDRAFASGSWRAAWRRHGWLYLALGATWALPICCALATDARGGSAGWSSELTWWRYGLTQCRAIAHYLRLCLWPAPLVFDYGFAVVRRADEIPGPILIVTLLLLASALALWRRPKLGFFGAAFFLALAPSSSVVPIATQTMAEHRMYGASAAILIPFVTGLVGWLGRAGFGLGVAAAMSPAAAAHVAARNRDYRSAVALWSDTVAKQPENPRAQSSLGLALSDQRRFAEAIAHHETALRLAPGYAEAHNNFGATLVSAGRLPEGIAQFEEALRLSPNYPALHFNLGCALFQSGRMEEAAAQFEAALRLDPAYPDAQDNLGNALVRLGRPAEGLPHFAAALQGKPEAAQFHYNSANALLALGRTGEAVAQYRAALRLDPGYVDAHNNLGVTLGQAGQWPEAAREFEAALRLEPGSAEAGRNLAFAQQRLGLESKADARP